MEFIVINKGVVRDLELEKDFVFRSFLDMPIGLAYFYLVEKTPEVVELEMKMMANGDRNAPVFHKSINKAWPVFWEDDMPEIPMACMNVFQLVLLGKHEIISIDEEFKDNHEKLFQIYAYNTQNSKNG